MSLISTWSTVANANGTLGGTPFYWPEGQAPSTVNDCARLMMATIRSQWNDAQWFNWGYTVTRVSGNSFTVVTASANTVTLPANFAANSRIKCYGTSTIYGTVQTVSVSALSTLVTFTPDAGSLTASFTSVYNSILTPTNTAIPGLNIPTNVITQQTQQIFAIDTGIANAAQTTYAPAIVAYVTGQILTFKAAATNTGPTTLQVDALGAKTIKKNGGATDLAAGDIIIGQMVTVEYDGANFQMICPTAPGGGGGGTVTGAILQVISATLTTTFSATTAQAAFTDVTGLEVTITPASNTNKILVMWDVPAAVSSSGDNGFLRIIRDITPICIGDANGSHTQASNTILRYTADAGSITQASNSYLDSPATVAAVTYKVQIANNDGSSTIYVNQTSTDSNSAFYGRCASTLTVMEVKA